MHLFLGRKPDKGKEFFTSGIQYALGNVFLPFRYILFHSLSEKIGPVRHAPMMAGYGVSHQIPGDWELMDRMKRTGG
ncbi:hypothetical protein Abiwalacus_24630 [Akkermansia biwaensis]|uniref:Uncharacterized protein n=1 Tax=Akkermansia biwaensis TaxID=2946555 RepID=A0ABM7ZK60_9BACT|nr:hypothetical protein Abiwalacus_24630 [Akkermansia biwaensis]